MHLPKHSSKTLKATMVSMDVSAVLHTGYQLTIVLLFALPDVAMQKEAAVVCEQRVFLFWGRFEGGNQRL